MFFPEIPFIYFRKLPKFLVNIMQLALNDFSKLLFVITLQEALTFKSGEPNLKCNDIC